MFSQMETCPENKLSPSILCSSDTEKPATLKAVQMSPQASEALIKDCIMTTDTAWHIQSLFN